MRFLVAALVAVAVLAAPAQADAWISKREARHYAVKVVRDLWLDTEDSHDYWVERAWECDRIDGNRVECDFELYYLDGDTCWDAVRIVSLSATRYAARFPYDPECG